jgi:hypothetical protein
MGTVIIAYDNPVTLHAPLRECTLISTIKNCVWGYVWLEGDHLRSIPSPVRTAMRSTKWSKSNPVRKRSIAR